ncbi:MAG: hypothetical protein OEM64_15180 [Gammaproteobacteria bacterium]|nr:hypothetical protein [Gammaproteobacteria bacterium]MDH3417650.1 hypothetical protein [Gammaproteobacteria bacterium]
MTRIARTIQAAFVPFALLAATAIFADTSTEFVRIAEDDQNRATALQIAVVTYVPRDERPGLRVDLVGAIHIGDPAYYKQLNDLFEAYDVLLYELVAPADAMVTQRVAKRKGLLSTTQLGLTRLLDLSFQLDEINYDRENFVHADLSPSELKQSMEDRGESLYVYFWRLFYASVDNYAKDPLGLNDMQKISSVLSAGQDDSLKTLIAYEMTDMGQLQDVLGEDSGSAVIGARNERAIDVLQREIAAGAKRIGIFYGVAHMPDLEERLMDQVGLVYEDTTWVDAWQLGSAPATDQ